MKFFILCLKKSLILERIHNIIEKYLILTHLRCKTYLVEVVKYKKT